MKVTGGHWKLLTPRGTAEGEIIGGRFDWRPGRHCPGPVPGSIKLTLTSATRQLKPTVRRAATEAVLLDHRVFFLPPRIGAERRLTP
jgi:hypothetical protein